MELRARRLGSHHGVCLRCCEAATITVHETRYVRGWRQLLDPAFDPAVVRAATCSACATTYPVRRDDRTAAPAARRRDVLHPPSSRDWAYPEQAGV